MDAYYRLLNCGFRPGFGGGSDYPCSASIGDVITYVQVDGPLTYRKWIDGLAAGRTVVSRNGHNEFLDLKVNSNAIPGTEIHLSQPGTVNVDVTWSVNQSIWGTIEIVQNGTVVASRSITARANRPKSLSATLTFTNSGWVCARRMGSGGHQSHTAAVFVLVNNKPIRTSVSDAEYFVDWMDQLIARVAPGNEWNYYYSTTWQQAQARFQAARQIYQQIALEAAGPVPLSVATTTLPEALTNTAYSEALQASGGEPPYTWTITAGQLPGGLTLSTAGLLSGVPTNVESASFTVEVQDSAVPAQTASRAFNLVVGDGFVPPGLIGNTNSGTASDSITGSQSGSTLAASWRNPTWSCRSFMPR